ncbi:unnamed protein product [Plutella xylostella]|uniref:(diamondback moth) hypothetical protein n=1 Tax=Plutella xylostella TaxID=51655 RepID=A0A8S4G1H9_PLUXY|nr:unnamed protein product [Plutella xylostella]
MIAQKFVLCVVALLVLVQSVTSHFGYGGGYGGGFGGGLGGGAIIIGGYKRFGYGGGFYQRPYAPYAPQFFYPRPPPPPFPYPYYG